MEPTAPPEQCAPRLIANVRRTAISMKNRYVQMILALFFAAMAGLEVSTQSSQTLVGAWRLLSYEAVDSSGRVEYPIGEHVTGQLLYDAQGNVSVHIMREKRPEFVSNDFARG